MNIAAVVVTYNRVELLKECLQAILNQTIHINTIYVIDNCSTDNTKEEVNKICRNNPSIIYQRLSENIGGAGGFNEGIKIAYRNNHDYIWIMDDDTIPNYDSIDKMINNEAVKQNNRWGFLCSNVLWKDHSPCKMNIPEVDNIWNEFSGNNLIKLKSASFVSILIKRDVVNKIGLPIKEFFIWGDDVEYSKRITSKYDGFMVTDSIVVHKMGINEGTNIIKENGDRINRYFYMYRNLYYINRKLGIKSLVRYYISVIRSLIKVITTKNQSKIKKIHIMFKGFFNGVVFNPKIEYVDKVSKSI